MSEEFPGNLAQQLLVRDFREYRSRSRFALMRIGRPSWRTAGTRFQAEPAPGYRPICAGCLNYACSPMLVCAIHPEGPSDEGCRDYRNC